MRTVIKNARMVNEGTVTEGDLAIRDGRIDRIGGVIDGDRAVDARGAWLIPGMIDDQVHFREPGFEHKAEIATESRAALAGGITSYMEMPNCLPQTVTAEALAGQAPARGGEVARELRVLLRGHQRQP